MPNQEVKKEFSHANKHASMFSQPRNTSTSIEKLCTKLVSQSEIVNDHYKQVISRIHSSDLPMEIKTLLYNKLIDKLLGDNKRKIYPLNNRN